MELIRAGDGAAFRILLERYWPPLVAYAADIVGDRDSAKDVVQTGFIKVWTTRSGWKPAGTVKAYLYRITRNLCLNHLRDRRRHRRRLAETGEIGFGQVTPPPDRDLEATALREEVTAAISRLSERRREVFVLSRFHGLSHMEIAETLGTSPQTVGNQMSAALDELRSSLCHLRVDR